MPPPTRSPTSARSSASTQPIWQQFGIWIGNILQGNFGESFFFKKTVAELIAQRVEPTLALVDLHPDLRHQPRRADRRARGLPPGLVFDRVVMAFSVLGFSVPAFVIGYCLIYVFAIELGWLPVQGYVRIGVNFGGSSSAWCCRRSPCRSASSP